MKETTGIKIISTNRKASFNYFLSDFLECGIELLGSEIKSLKLNSCTINDAYVIIKNNEAFVLNMHITPYEKGNIFNPDENRTRKLLLHKLEILRLNQRMIKEGMTLIPTKVYLKKGRCKVEIALGKGKKNFDKRDSIKKRDDERYMSKIAKRG